jgi:two-component system CheB/CheR fusion protein
VSALKLKTMDSYLPYLTGHSTEAHLLAEDLLIHVTEFFRDPEAFEALKKRVFPIITKHKGAGAPLRCWSAGCASGEEAYSISMSLIEYLGDRASDVPIQIFGSDMSERSIEVARQGLYPEAVVRKMDDARVTRFFSKTQRGYRIQQRVRDMCVFVRHDIARDPPFSKLDLISCRNVLMYFAPALQKKLVPLFHYALHEPGFLLLGHSEAITGFSQLFDVVSKRHQIYVRRPGPARLGLPLGTASRAPSTQVAVLRGLEGEVRSSAMTQRAVDQLLLAKYAPPSVVVSEDFEVVQFRGRTGPYLEPPPGQATHSVLRLARDGLLPELRKSLTRAKAKGVQVRCADVQVRSDDRTRTIQLSVFPVQAPPSSSKRQFLVVFDEAHGASSRGSPARSRKSTKAVPIAEYRRVSDELDATRAYLESLLEEQQTTTSSALSANEELLSTNEELQSTNEELETAKEELQSANEELTTVNDELQSRNQELGQLNSDLVNVLRSVDIPIIILDGERKIRRFTPHASAVMNLIPSDVGRPIGDIKLNLDLPEFEDWIRAVQASLTVKETEVRDRSGTWHRIQIRPYQTLDNRIDGVVITLVDIDALKHSVDEAKSARDFAKSVVETVPLPLLIVDAEIHAASANSAYYRVFGASRAETEGRAFFDLAAGQWTSRELRARVEGAIATGTPFEGIELDCDISRLGRRKIVFRGQPLAGPDRARLALLAIEDVTEQRQDQDARASMLALERANREKDLFLAMLSHELRTPLNAILLWVQMLLKNKLSEEQTRHALETIEASAKVQSKVVDDVLDVSRFVMGKLKIEQESVDLAAVVETAIETVRMDAEARSIALHVSLHRSAQPVRRDAARLAQVVWNLAANAVKFTPPGGRIDVDVRQEGNWTVLRVSDTGEGIAPEFLPRIFERFAQHDSSTTRSHSGLGLGLAIVRHLVELHGGTISAVSPGRGQGSTFTVRLPGVNVASRATDASEHRLEGMRVLVVDDDTSGREAAVETLKRAGADARSAESAAAALALLDSFIPDVLLCDLAMPGEDGFSLIRKVRERGPALGGEVPAGALSAHVGEPERRRALEAGFQLHIGKPLDRDRLVAAVAHLDALRQRTGKE